MPRLARLDAPGVFHHVMIGGIERGKILRNKQDREEFLNRLGKLLTETQITCYGWVLFPNHAHFLLRARQLPEGLIFPIWRQGLSKAIGMTWLVVA